jgi:hypothetical protein
MLTENRTIDRLRRQVHQLCEGFGRTQPTEDEMREMFDEVEAPRLRAARLSWDAPEGRGWIGDEDVMGRAA